MKKREKEGDAPEHRGWAYLFSVHASGRKWMGEKTG